jgi:5-methylcytosine-specific restriction endonuclease McrA
MHRWSDLTGQVFGRLTVVGSTQSCGCLQRENTSRANRKYRNPAVRKLLGSYIRSAQVRGHEYSISEDVAEKIFLGNCFYCGVKPSRIATEYRGRYSITYNGMDRVDNDIGYVESNLVSCCKDCNYAKNTMTQKAFVTWLFRAYVHLQSIGLMKGICE